MSLDISPHPLQNLTGKTETNKKPKQINDNKKTHLQTVAINTHTQGGGTTPPLLSPAGFECPTPHPVAGTTLRRPEASGAAAVASSGLCVLRSSPLVIPARRPGPGGRPGRSRGGPGTTKRAVKPPGGGCICCPVCEVRWLPGPGRSQCCCGH